MRIQMYPVRQTMYLTKEEIEVVNINFDIFMNNESFDKLNLSVKFNAEGKVVNFPALGKLNVDNPAVYIELGKAIQYILSLEGEYIKNYYEELFNENNSFEDKTMVFDV